MGENMIRLAKENADQNIIGVEPLLNGQCNLADYCLNNFVKNKLSPVAHIVQQGQKVKRRFVARI